MSVYLSVVTCLSTCQLSHVCLPVSCHMSVYLSVVTCLSTCQLSHVCLPVSCHMSVYLSVVTCLSTCQLSHVCLPVSCHMSVYLSVVTCLSTCQLSMVNLFLRWKHGPFMNYQLIMNIGHMSSSTLTTVTLTSVFYEHISHVKFYSYDCDTHLCLL